MRLRGVRRDRSLKRRPHRQVLSFELNRFELHYLCRSKFLFENGPPIHHGIGIFDTRHGI